LSASPGTEPLSRHVSFLLRLDKLQICTLYLKRGSYSDSPGQRSSMRTLILGMGSPIVSDDGVGLKVAERLRERLSGRNDIEVLVTSQAGLILLDIMAGFERVIIVDAIQTRDGLPGTVYRLSSGDFDQARHAATVHGVGLLSALELGQTLELGMPCEVVLFAVEAEDVTTFSEECTPRVKDAMPWVEDLVLREVGAGDIGDTQC